MRTTKAQIILRIRPVWSESSLCAHWVAKDPSFLDANTENSDQTRRSLRWAHSHIVGFVVLRLKSPFLQFCWKWNQCSYRHVYTVKMRLHCDRNHLHFLYIYIYIYTYIYITGKVILSPNVQNTMFGSKMFCNNITPSLDGLWKTGKQISNLLIVFSALHHSD